MKHFYANGRGTPFSIPILNSKYLHICRKSGLVALLICLFSFQFVCLAQESPVDREATEVGEEVNYLRSENIKEDSLFYTINSEGRPVFNYDFDKYPIVRKYTLDSAKIIPVHQGDSLYDDFWSEDYWCIDPVLYRDSLTLSEYKDAELLILDFWSVGCAPCIRSMQKLHEISQAYNGRVKVIGVLLGNAYTGLPYTKFRGWAIPSIIGDQALSLVRNFFKEELLGYAVLIKNNRLLGITAGTALSDQIVEGILEGTISEITNLTSFVY